MNEEQDLLRGGVCQGQERAPFANTSLGSAGSPPPRLWKLVMLGHGPRRAPGLPLTLGFSPLDPRRTPDVASLILSSGNRCSLPVRMAGEGQTGPSLPGGSRARGQSEAALDAVLPRPMLLAGSPRTPQFTPIYGLSWQESTCVLANRGACCLGPHMVTGRPVCRCHPHVRGLEPQATGRGLPPHPATPGRRREGRPARPSGWGDELRGRSAGLESGSPPLRLGSAFSFRV